MFKPVLIGMLFSCAVAAADPAPLADPLRPEGMDQGSMGDAKTSSPSALPRLSMIVRHHQHPYAVIDGQPRRLGEQWAGYRLLDIGSSSVLLEREGGEKIELGLLPGAVIKKNISQPQAGNLHP